MERRSRNTLIIIIVIYSSRTDLAYKDCLRDLSTQKIVH